ncbi:MAG: glycosyltransferase family 2 protein [Candidatus Omnitrophica bacterium]|jgi:glycosyltransferase involved in cell wall biosynthesis|nr:glycosyltransferase family 2 protein [Candidatus Omnitrophota bacterium]
MTDPADIELSVVMPCLNEEAGIGTCIKKTLDVFARDNIRGEIIVADNGSVDRSMEIARELGAKVVLEARQGYGAAYLRGLGEARGRYIIIGDSDNTYDFRDIPKFLALLREGFDFVMGSRFKGRIRAGAMPWMNRYVGNPILSGICRIFFHTSLSDIHCGMRGFSRQAYLKMDLITLGMEFATEMVVSALRNKLKICEVSIDYELRSGKSKLSPLADAWRHVRFMLLYSPGWLYFIPGILGFVLGGFLMAVLSGGPVFFLGRYWDIHVLAFASAWCILSFQILNLGVYAHIFAVKQGFLNSDRLSDFFERKFDLEKGILTGALLFLSGLAINSLIFIEWLSKHFGSLYRIRESIFALTLLVIGLQTIFSSFFISFLSLKRK